MENYLKKEDTTNSKTMTYQILTRVSERAEGYLRAYNRAHEYDLALFNQLKVKAILVKKNLICLKQCFIILKKVYRKSLMKFLTNPLLDNSSNLWYNKYIK